MFILPFCSIDFNDGQYSGGEQQKIKTVETRGMKRIKENGIRRLEETGKRNQNCVKWCRKKCKNKKTEMKDNEAA